MREDISKIPPVYFKGCDDCAKCCEGKFAIAPLILEDFKKVKDYFDIRAIILNDEVIPVMILAKDGKCRYLENSKCTIYEKRPPACRIYPFSPFYDKLFLDLSCDGISNNGERLPSNFEEFEKSKFFDDRFIEFRKKRERTIDVMKNRELQFDYELKGLKIYKFDFFDLI